MVIRIFRTQRNLRESWLAVNEDGTATYHLRNFGSRLMREGPEERNRSMTAHEAKLRWPFFSKSIDLAVAEVAKQRYKSLEPTSRISAGEDGTVRVATTKHFSDKWRSQEKREHPRHTAAQVPNDLVQ